MEQGTFQAWFEKAIKGVIAQGKPAMRGDRCLYKMIDEDGKELRCAVGFMLTSEQIDCTIMHMAGAQKLLSKGMPASDVLFVDDFIVDIQRQHDNAARAGRYIDDPAARHSVFVSEFIKNMSAIADKYDLKFPSL